MLRGSCTEVRPLCEAMCCREWDVDLSAAERDAKVYQVDTLCILTDRACEKKVDACVSRRYRLKKKGDGSCVYLAEDNRCSNYENRPSVCREFSCQGGWRLGSVFPTDAPGKDTAAKIEKAGFVGRLRDDMIFVLHPLLKLHTVFYLEAKREIIFVKEMAGACGKFNTREDYYHPGLREEHILGLVGLLDKKEPLSQVRECLRNQYGLDLAIGDFYELIWLLNRQNVILESRNLRGLLSGMGLM